MRVGIALFLKDFLVYRKDNNYIPTILAAKIVENINKNIQSPVIPYFTVGQ